MAMVINNNSSAQMALGELRKNNSKLDKASRQAASGVKIGGAGDGASEYSISEKMRVQIRGLEQDIANAQTGTSLIKTAEGGIQDIIDNLRSLKELALNAANDHNTDLDRETIQKEVNSRLETIDDIAATTNYNGRLLLNGDYGIPIKIDKPAPGEPTGTPTLIGAGTYDYNITSDGVYSISSNYHGNINITAKNVKLIPETASAQLTAIAIKTSPNGGTNLWLDDISIDNASTYDSNALYANGPCNVVQFQGSGNTLNIRNSVDLRAGNYGGQGSTQFYRETSAVINIGDGLTINGFGNNSSLKAALNDTGSGQNCEGAAIGTNRMENSSGNLTINNIGTLKTFSECGTNIGSGAGGSIGDITIKDVGVLEIIGTRGGTGIGHTGGGSCGNISVDLGIMYGKAWDYGAVISGNNVSITADYLLLATRGNVTASVGNYSVSGGTTGAVTISSSSAVVNGIQYDPNGSSYAANPSYLNHEVLESYPARDNGTINNGIKLHGLVIHTGTKANQHLRVIINSMDTDTLGIQPLPVNPRDAAVTALSTIDSAIDYSLNENTRMGAYQTRLDFTIANLTTASENTQSSESVIRDADMAKAMMEHAKYNILSQSSQAMLAQANQNSSGVLSLLQ